MQDKTILITGATSGIGKETAKALAKNGARVLFNSRNEQKGKETQAEIQEFAGHDKVHFTACDLSSLKQIRHFADWASQATSQIDVLIHNAGVFSISRRVSQDGFEEGWAVNYLAPYLLTHLLADQVKEADQGRIIFVSSVVHKMGKIDVHNLSEEKSTFNPFYFYGKSKLAQILFMKELAHRLNQTQVTANALHPGVIGTSIARDFPKPIQSLFRAFVKTPRQGAETTLFLASNTIIAQTSGKYFVNQKEAKYHALGDDEAFRKALWEGTCEQLGLEEDWV